QIDLAGAHVEDQRTVVDHLRAADPIQLDASLGHAVRRGRRVVLSRSDVESGGQREQGPRNVSKLHAGSPRRPAPPGPNAPGEHYRPTGAMWIPGAAPPRRAMIRAVESTTNDRPPAAVLAAFGLSPGTARPAASGLINRTWHVRSAAGEPLVLQRVNRIFPAAINDDIDALTRHLESRGLTTPRIVPPLRGGTSLRLDGETWRVLTAIDGIARDALDSPAEAREAGRILATFHRAVADF